MQETGKRRKELLSIANSLVKRVFLDDPSLSRGLASGSYRKYWGERIHYVAESARGDGRGFVPERLYFNEATGVFADTKMFFRPADRIAVVTTDKNEVEGLSLMYPDTAFETINPQDLDSEIKELGSDRYDRVIIEGISERTRESMGKLTRILKEGGIIRATGGNEKITRGDLRRSSVLADKGNGIYIPQYRTGAFSDLIIAIKAWH